MEVHPSRVPTPWGKIMDKLGDNFICVKQDDLYACPLIQLDVAWCSVQSSLTFTTRPTHFHVDLDVCSVLI